MRIFTYEKDKKSLDALLNEIEDTLYYAIFSVDQQSKQYLERLLIGILGHRNPDIRERAVVYLNILYDGVDWQLRGPFKGKVSTVGSEFKLDYLIESDANDDNLILLVNSYSFDGSN